MGHAKASHGAELTLSRQETGAPLPSGPGGVPWLRSLGEALLVLLAACVLITIVTWPWATVLGSAVSTHWDVGLHAWKLNWNAQNILDGHVLFPVYHANFYYPQAYTLALDDLFWIPSYFAAVILGLSHNAILTYNLTFLFSWALSAVFVYLLLRELALGRTSALLGALAFDLLPYLASYYIEFNGELCYGIPLVMWLLLRFFKKPGIGIAIALAVGFWVQAVSALYYATILGLSIPLVALPLLRERAEVLRTRRFWLAAATCVVVVVGLCYLYLYPYLLLHNQMELRRSLGDMALHSANALTYLLPYSGYVPHTGSIWPRIEIPAALTESILWPGVVVVVLALIYWHRFRWIPYPGDKALAGGHPGLVPLRWARLVFLGVFWAWEVLATFGNAKFFGGDLGAVVLNTCLLGALLTSLALSLVPRRLGMRGRFVAGLGTAALLCFFISLGPQIKAAGHYLLAKDLLVYFFSDAEVIGATQVLSRYAIMVLFAMVVVSAIAFESLPLRRPIRLAALGLALVLITLEADVAITNPYLPLTNYPDPKLEQFLSSQEPCSIVVLPIGNRILDSAYMLKVAGARPQRYMLNGWTGFQNHHAKHLSGLFSSGNWVEAMHGINLLWPRPLIVADREALGYFSAKQGHKTSEKTLRERTKLLFEDRAYAVFEPLPPAEPTPHYERWVRNDLLEKTTAIRFQARSAGPGPQAPALFYINDGIAARLTLTREWRPYEIKVSKPDLSIPYNALALVSPPEKKLPLEVRDFQLIFR